MDTKLFVNKTPGGLFAVRDVAEAPGSVFYVHSSTGTDAAGYGTNPQAPFASLDYAVGSCTLSKGDVIYCLPRHTETLTASVTVALDVSGTKVMGLGWGPLAPTFTYSTTDSIITISGANCWLENIRLVGDVDDIVKGINLTATADGTTLKNITIIDGAANKEFLIGVNITAACHNVTIDGMRMCGLGGGATSCIINAGASDNVIVRNCNLMGTWSGACLDFSGAASANLLIADNYLVNRDASNGIVIKGHATNTGLVARNFVCGSKSNTETINTPGTLHFAENYGTDASGIGALLTPAAITAWS